MSTHIGRDNVGGSSYEMSGDFRQAIINITTNYLKAGANPQLHNEEQFHAALNRYLRWVERTYGRLTLRGLKEREAGQLTFDLDEIYTSLEVEVNLETDERRRRWTRRSQQDNREQMENAGLQTIDMTQLLALDDRLVITGGPGSGKSTYLHLIASSVARALRTGDGDAVERTLGLTGPLPLPVVVSLAGYNRYRREGKGTLIDYISYAIIEQNGAIGLPDDFFRRLLFQGRSCCLLLDGLDEVARDDERALVRERVQTLANNDGVGRLIVTSRTRAYQGQAVFPFRVATVKPMTPEQVKVLAGKWCHAAYEPDEVTRQTENLQREIEQLEALRAERDQPRLVITPLLVTIVAIVHDNLNKLPQQRAELYEECVKALLSEHYRTPSEAQTTLVEWGGKFNEKRNVLARLAFEMMTAARGAEPMVKEAQLKSWVRPLVVKMRGEKQADRWLESFTEAMRERGSLLDERDGEYRFIHLTFLEYLAATYLADAIGDAQAIVTCLTDEDRLAKSWWRETVLLTVGYIDWRSPDRALSLQERLASVEAPAEGDCETALAAAELTGASFLELGGHDERARSTIANRLVALLTDEKLTATNQLRGLAGVALSRLGDPRPGVGVIVRGGLRLPGGLLLPDIAWGETVPAGVYTIGGDKDAYSAFKRRQVTIARPFQLARYPLTYTQFDCFIRASDFADARWWAGMPAEEEAYGTRYRLRELSEGAFQFANHPRERISWYQAVAFCRWLSDKLGEAIDLPHEYEWEVAARYPDGRFYPWGKDFDSAKANTAEGNTIGQTSAVGIFPQGATALGLYDLIGNVWEWCRNKYDNPDDDAVDASGARRVVRGGSWYSSPNDARAAYRGNPHPNSRYYFRGCRVVCRPPSQAH